MKKLIISVVLTAILFPLTLLAQKVQVEEYVLPNGMTFLLVPRRGDPNVVCGWIAKVGSVNERPGITGISHLFEHMMFKGTHAIGTRNIEQDLRIISRLDKVKSRLMNEEKQMTRRLRLGEIENLTGPDNKTVDHKKLLEEFNGLLSAQKELLIKNEFDRIYTTAGASQMNAGTSQDFTIYYINVPANKLELWFWMESDRLSNPVFREFYSERDVVREERRLRTESTPTGRFREEFNALFWTAHPYSWPVVGWPSDLEGITRQEALDYFSINYAPNNLAACLVGDFDSQEVKKLADKYFGTLKRSAVLQPSVRTREVEQMAEKRMIAYAETNPEVEIRYHTVADGHRDDAALTVVGVVLSGRTGRLYKALVDDQKLANQASAVQDSGKWAGSFSITGIAKPGHTPEELEQAMYRELDRLRKNPLEDRELQKIKNRFSANEFRRMENNFSLMFQLLIAENNRGWNTFNTDPARIQAVTSDDILQVMGKYFKRENRTVGIYYTKEIKDKDSEALDPLLAKLSRQERVALQPILADLEKTSGEKIREKLVQMDQAQKGIPEGQKRMLEVLKSLLGRRLKELEEKEK